MTIEMEELDRIQDNQKNNDKPININFELFEIQKKIAAIGNPDEKMRVLELELDHLNLITPDWFWCKTNGAKPDILDGYDHVKMANALIDKYKLFKFPKLREGAVYNQERGYWRYFGKNEMKDFAEKETLKELEKWGYYDIQHIPPTRIYITQKTYDDSFADMSPFTESRPELVVFKNGTYNMLTGEMRKNRYDDYILNAHSYELDTSGRETPNTDSLLKGFVGDSALFLKQYIGYLFYRSYAPAQEMLFFKGDGGEGKSTLINFIAKHLIGDENVSAISPQELVEDKFSRIELLGKNVNLCADIPEQFINDSSILKRLTGCDRLLVQYKGIQGFSMISYAKMIFSANKLPRFKDLSDGFSDRLAVVKFINGDQREEGATFWKNHDMDKVEEEAPAFAYACMNEFRKIFDGKKAQFTKSESVKEETSKWLFDNDHIAEFLMEAVEFYEGDPRGEICSVTHEEYFSFNRQSGYKPKSVQQFREYLESKHGIYRKKSRKGF